MSRRLTSLRVGVGCALLTTLIGVSGCYKPVKKVPAFGTVTLDGEPLRTGMLEFVPDPSKGGTTARVSSTSRISKGKFNLKTYGMNNADTGPGAPVGWFKVRYMNPNERGFDPTTGKNDGSPRVAMQYRNEETSPISIELTDPAPPEGYKIELFSK